MCNRHQCALIHPLVRCSERRGTLEMGLCNLVSSCSQILCFFILITLHSLAGSLFEAGTASAYISSCFFFLGCCVPFCALPKPGSVSPHAQAPHQGFALDATKSKCVVLGGSGSWQRHHPLPRGWGSPASWRAHRAGREPGSIPSQCCTQGHICGHLQFAEPRAFPEML